MIASVMAFTLVSGLALATVGFLQARRERDRAVEAEALANREAENAREAERLQSELRQAAEEAHEREARQRTLAEENAIRVQREAEATESINDFFVDMLAMADPMMHTSLLLGGSPGEDVGAALAREESVAEMLKRASGMRRRSVSRGSGDTTPTRPSIPSLRRWSTTTSPGTCCPWIPSRKRMPWKRSSWPRRW